jgi:ADP-heptose:LPS heptosyltransferase
VNAWLDARNILVVRLGDAAEVRGLGPALRAVKETSPGVRLTLLTSLAGSAAGTGLPWIDRVITWQPTWRDDRAERTLIGELTGHGFDAALIFTARGESPHIAGYLCYLAGIPLRAGISREFGGRILTAELKPAPETCSGSARNRWLVEQLGFTAGNGRLPVTSTLPPALQPPGTALRRIAVVRALHLGDLLVAVPGLRALRAGFPEAEITLIGLPWAAEFVRRFRHCLDRFVEFVGYDGLGEVKYVPARTERFLQEQRAYGYDLVVQMHGSGRASNPLALAIGADATAGYYEGEPPAGLTFGAPYPDDRPEVLRHLGMARLLGCPDRGVELEFPLFDEDRAEAAALLNRLSGSSRPWIGIHPGARPPSRRWPAAYFARAADEFVRRFGARIILTGGPGEEETVRAVIERMETRPVSVAGETSLGGLAALISELDLFISNDTGPAHVAEAVATPSVTIFGSADHRRWAPLNQERHRIVRHPVACNPCSHWECPIDHRCLRRLEPGLVVDAAADLLRAGAPA